jgi:hypothetical protein
MHYMVSFLHLKKGNILAATPPSIAHFETDGGGMIPNIGDVIHIEQTTALGRSSYQGTVTNRIYSYVNAGNCDISVVFEEHLGRNGD